MKHIAVMKLRLPMAALMLGLLACEGGAQTVYRTQDASGRVTYTDVPPPRPSTKVPVRLQTEEEKAHARARLKEFDDDRKAQRAKDQAIVDAKRKNCEDLRVQLEMFRGAKDVYWGREGLPPLTLNDRERAELIRQLERGVAAACRDFDVR